jgi:prolyl-tRNA synthetase
VGIEVDRMIADYGIQGMKNVVTGANAPDAHLINVNLGRDFAVDEFADLRLARDNDPCPRCAGRLQISRGIEVGHIFKLGTKYSEAMGATFLDAQGQECHFVMGCYGIGLGRTVAAAIEQHHDQDGIMVPMSIAPFHVIILPVNNRDQRVMTAASDLYHGLLGQGVEVLFDDRDERPGVKFKDADLIGIPLRVTVGQKNLRNAKVEIKERRSDQVRLIGLDGAVETIVELINAEVQALNEAG